MKWRVMGADEQSGKDRQVDVDAPDRGTAEQVARSRHVLVSDVKLIDGVGYATTSQHPPEQGTFQSQRWNPGGRAALVFAAFFYFAGFAGLVITQTSSGYEEIGLRAAQEASSAGDAVKALEVLTLKTTRSTNLGNCVLSITAGGIFHLVHHASRCYSVLRRQTRLESLQ